MKLKEQGAEKQMQYNNLDRRRYHEHWDTLSRELRAEEDRGDGLAGAVRLLHFHQLTSGFIKDDLADIQCYHFPHPRQPDRFLSVQYNPARVKRLKLRVGAIPPVRGDATNDDCFLCERNIQWQHKGTEMGYEIDINGTPYVIWMNAYPLMPVHVVVTTRDHVPQDWQLDNAPGDRFSIRHIIENLVSLSTRLPGYISFYNGDGAGTSIPGHFHYQCFQRRDDNARFPLEMAPKRQLDGSCFLIDDYPVTAVCWEGDVETVAEDVSKWISHWLSGHGNGSTDFSANIFSIIDGDTGKIQIYFIPRDRDRCHSPHMAGMIGCLEVLGELVLTTENEKRDIDRGMIDYRKIETILFDVSVDL